MSGFIATPPTPHSPAGASVEADNWFPAIDVNAVRAAIRLRGDVTHARLVAAIEGGIVTVIGDLIGFKASWIASGAADLAAVAPQDTLGGRHRLSLLFERAVRYAAAAELSDMARDISATSDGAQRLAEESIVAEDMRRLSLCAVRDMLGVTRVDVELI